MIGSETRGEGEMDFAGYLQKGILILQLDADTIREVYRDEDALLPAICFFAIGGLAMGVGQLSIRWVIFGVCLMTLVSFVLVGLLHVFVRLFGGTASFLELYRPIGAAATVHWVQVIPFIGGFLGPFALRKQRADCRGPSPSSSSPCSSVCVCSWASFSWPCSAR
jgi:hypothetical protein